MGIPLLPCSRCWRLTTVSQFIHDLALTVGSLTQVKVKVKVTLRLTSVGQLLLMWSPFYQMRFMLPSNSYDFVDVGRSLWREDGSVIYRCHNQQYMLSVFAILHVGILRSASVVKESSTLWIPTIYSFICNSSIYYHAYKGMCDENNGDLDKILGFIDTSVTFSLTHT
jgi:hypothetical protein